MVDGRPTDIPYRGTTPYAAQYAFRQSWGRLKTKTSYAKATIIEVGNLINLPDNYQKNVLTANRMDVGEVDGVKVMHVVDWLVGKIIWLRYWNVIALPLFMHSRKFTHNKSILIILRRSLWVLKTKTFQMKPKV